MAADIKNRRVLLYNRELGTQHHAIVGYSPSLETYRAQLQRGIGQTTIGTRMFEVPTVNSLVTQLRVRGLHTTPNRPEHKLQLVAKDGRIIPKVPNTKTGPDADHMLHDLEYEVAKRHGDIELVGLPHPQNSSLYLVGRSGTAWARLGQGVGAQPTTWGHGRSNIDTAQILVDRLTLSTDATERYEQALDLSHNWLDQLDKTKPFSASLTSISSTIVAGDTPSTQLEPADIASLRQRSGINQQPPRPQSLHLM